MITQKSNDISLGNSPLTDIPDWDPTVFSALSGTTFTVVTFGCQMNKHDSERIVGMLSALGSQQVSSIEESDIIIYVTCCVREAADVRLFGQVSSLKNIPLKKIHPFQSELL